MTALPSLISPAVLAPLVERVVRLRAASDHPRLLLGIAGVPGAGKTTLALALIARLAEALPDGGAAVAHAPMDGFHLADAALERHGLRDRKGAPETFDPDGYAALLRRLRDGDNVWAPAFDRGIEQPIAQSVEVGSRVRVVVSEGNYLLLPDPPWRAARSCFDEVWFCRTEADDRRERLIARHVEFGKTPDEAAAWVTQVDEPNAALVEAAVAGADLIVDI